MGVTGIDAGAPLVIAGDTTAPFVEANPDVGTVVAVVVVAELVVVVGAVAAVVAVVALAAVATVVVVAASLDASAVTAGVVANVTAVADDPATAGSGAWRDADAGLIAPAASGSPCTPAPSIAWRTGVPRAVSAAPAANGEARFNASAIKKTINVMTTAAPAKRRRMCDAHAARNSPGTDAIVLTAIWISARSSTASRAWPGDASWLRDCLAVLAPLYGAAVSALAPIRAARGAAASLALARAVLDAAASLARPRGAADSTAPA